MRPALALLVTALVTGSLAACGGGASAPAATPPPPPTQTVQGLTTPKSVSVVTAN
jgi:hypothetical protein